MIYNIHDSEPFDIMQQPILEIDSIQSYYDFCETQYFVDACVGNRVLEIGANHGDHSRRILKTSPCYFDIIEGDSAAAQQISSINHIDNIIIDDAMMALKEKKCYDVVICLGVLYHLHSPLHLLEMIVNNCNPNKIIMDCVQAPETLSFDLEMSNHPGNNQTRTKWRSCNLNFVVPFLTYLQAMDQLGFDLKKVHRIKVKNYYSKQSSWMALWETKNVQSQTSDT
jgi:SAM-dependent methyltransferase